MASKAQHAIKTKLTSFDKILNNTLAQSSINNLLLKQVENMETTPKVIVQIRMGKNLHYHEEEVKQQLPLQSFPFGFYLKYLKSETKLHQRILTYFKSIEKEATTTTPNKYIVLDETNNYYVPEFYFQSTTVFATFLKDLAIGVQFFNIPTKSTILVKELVQIAKTY